MHAIKKWLGLVLGLVGMFILSPSASGSKSARLTPILAVTIINVLLVAIAVIQRRSTNAGVLAVALVQATSLMLLLNWTIVMAAEVRDSVAVNCCLCDWQPNRPKRS